MKVIKQTFMKLEALNMDFFLRFWAFLKSNLTPEEMQIVKI